MTIADEARANALPCEMVKYALRQTKDGIVVSFVVHPNDIPAELQVSHIGSRWMAALVQIGDDETPVHKPKEPLQPDSQPRPAGVKRDWRDIPPAQQAGIRANEVLFQTFLKENYRRCWNEGGANPAECIRIICDINSRTELGTKHAARMLWHALDSEFEAWKLAEQVGA